MKKPAQRGLDDGRYGDLYVLKCSQFIALDLEKQQKGEFLEEDKKGDREYFNAYEHQSTFSVI